MQTQLQLEPANRRSSRISGLSASVSKTPDQIAERVAAAPTAIPEEYWFPAVPRPRRASLWNTLNHTRHLHPA